MEYTKFEEILNRKVIPDSYTALIKDITSYPEHYIGLFRPTKLEGTITCKLIENYEEAFKDAIESVVAEYLKEIGFDMISNVFRIQGEDAYVSQLFTDNKKIFFVEHKIIDDWFSMDEWKYVESFQLKADAIRAEYTEELVGFMHFFEDNCVKNKEYYEKELLSLSECNCNLTTHLCYGGELFEELGNSYVWSEMLEHLKKWKNQTPSIPATNLDKDANGSFAMLKNISPYAHKELLAKPELDEIVDILFPEGEVLKLLMEWSEQQHKKGVKNHDGLSLLCQQSIDRIHSRNTHRC